MSKLNLIKEIECLSINEDEYDDYESNKMRQEVAVAKMFTRLAKQGRDPIDMISHRFGWSTHELDDLAQQHGFKNTAEWMNSFERGVTEGKFTVNAKTGAKLHPRTGAELPPKEKPLTMKDMFRQPKSNAPKLTIDEVWRKVEDVVSRIFPDGDPIDYLAPWLERHGIRDFKIGEILDRAAKKNGYKDLYDYYNSMKDLYGPEKGVTEGYKEPTDAAGHAKMAAKIKKMLDDTLADSGDMRGNLDLQRLVRAYEYHMEKAKEKSKGVTEAKNPEEFISSISKIDPSFAKKEPAIFSRGETVEIKSEREASQDYGRYFGELAMVMVDSKDCITKRTKDGSKYKMIPVKIFNDHAEIRVSSRDLKPFTMDSFYHGVAEDLKAPAFNWASWDPDNYESGSPEYYSSLSNAILSLVKEKFGGKAWFDGGGYAYLIDVSNPKKLVSSDGADINVPNVARGLEKYTSNFKENFVEVYPSDWPDFFRSPRKRSGPESDQEWYELGKMGIGVRENSHKLSGQGVAEDNEQKYRVTYDMYSSNREKPLYTKTRTVRANSEEEAIKIIQDLIGGRNHRIEKGVAEGSIFASKQEKIRELKNLIAIATERGNMYRVQELELELKKLLDGFYDSDWEDKYIRVGGKWQPFMKKRSVAEGLNEAKTKTGPDISDYHVTASWKYRGTSHKRWDKDHMQGSPVDRHQSSIQLWQHEGKKPEYHAHHRIESGYWTDQTLEGPPTVVTHKSVHPSLDAAVDALEKHTNEFYKNKKAMKEHQGVAKGLNEAKTKTKTKPDISDTFKQKPDQPLTKKDDKKAEKPKDEPKGKTPEFKVSSKDETLKKTAGIRMNDRAAELSSKMKDVEADPDDPGYPKHETLPSTNVKPDNVPAVINKAMTVKGFLNPEWHIVANLPGNMATAIRTVGRKLFKSFTRTPTDKIVMIGNVMNHGPNTNAEINAVAKWLKNAGQEVSSGDIDFSDFMPGYKADIKLYDAAGCRFLLVEDFAGRYVYVWPHNDSVTMSNAPQLTKEDINIIKEAELRFRTLAGL